MITKMLQTKKELDKEMVRLNKMIDDACNDGFKITVAGCSYDCFIGDMGYDYLLEALNVKCNKIWQETSAIDAKLDAINVLLEGYR